MTPRSVAPASWRDEKWRRADLLIRTDMDALPILEQTGLPYASKVMMKDAVTGDLVAVMHACGHDVHMASWIGTATMLAQIARRGRAR